MLIVLTTVPTAEEAATLAEKIVTEKLGACVQILPQMTSVYMWKGDLRRESEHRLLVKTVTEKWDDLIHFISENHSYDVPEIVGLDAEKVSGPYLAWLKDLLSK